MWKLGWMGFLPAACLLVVCLSAVRTEGRLLTRCELVQILDEAGIRRSKMANWVCLIEAESGRNTSARGGPNSNGSFDHGLFQINDQYWCEIGKKGKDCNVSCEELKGDDLGPSLDCARKVFARHGFRAWHGWTRKCKGRRLPEVDHCYLAASTTRGHGHPSTATSGHAETAPPTPTTVRIPSLATIYPDYVTTSTFKSMMSHNFLRRGMPSHHQINPPLPKPSKKHHYPLETTIQPTTNSTELSSTPSKHHHKTTPHHHNATQHHSTIPWPITTEQDEATNLPSTPPTPSEHHHKTTRHHHKTTRHHHKTTHHHSTTPLSSTTEQDEATNFPTTPESVFPHFPLIPKIPRPHHNKNTEDSSSSTYVSENNISSKPDAPHPKVSSYPGAEMQLSLVKETHHHHKIKNESTTESGGHHQNDLNTSPSRPRNRHHKTSTTSVYHRNGLQNSLELGHHHKTIEPSTVSESKLEKDVPSSSTQPQHHVTHESTTISTDDHLNEFSTARPRVKPVHTHNYHHLETKKPMTTTFGYHQNDRKTNDPKTTSSVHHRNVFQKGQRHHHHNATTTTADYHQNDLLTSRSHPQHHQHKRTTTTKGPFTTTIVYKDHDLAVNLVHTGLQNSLELRHHHKTDEPSSVSDSYHQNDLPTTQSRPRHHHHKINEIFSTTSGYHQRELQNSLGLRHHHKTDEPSTVSDGNHQNELPTTQSYPRHHHHKTNEPSLTTSGYHKRELQNSLELRHHQKTDELSTMSDAYRQNDLPTTQAHPRHYHHKTNEPSSTTSDYDHGSKKQKPANKPPSYHLQQSHQDISTPSNERHTVPRHHYKTTHKINAASNLTDITTTPFPLKKAGYHPYQRNRRFQSTRDPLPTYKPHTF